MAVFDDSGNISSSSKFITDKDYATFISNLVDNCREYITQDIKSVAVGVPGLIDRSSGVVLALGNLPWKDKPIRDDIATKLGVENVVIENDSKLAGLAEAGAIKDQYSRVLYLTISTGIGGALVEHGELVKALEDTEMGQMPLSFAGAPPTPWEEFASGRAIVAKYGKQASEITDEEQWKEIGQRVAYGVGAVCSVLQPEAIVFGGGVGQYAEHFIGSVDSYLKANLHPVVRQPKALLATKFPNDAVLHGGYELSKIREI